MKNKQSLWIFVLFLLAIPIVHAVPFVYLNDTFNRANNNAVGGSWIETDTGGTYFKINESQLLMTDGSATYTDNLRSRLRVNPSSNNLYLLTMQVYFMTQANTEIGRFIIQNGTTSLFNLNWTETSISLSGKQNKLLTGSLSRARYTNISINFQTLANNYNVTSVKIDGSEKLTSNIGFISALIPSHIKLDFAQGSSGKTLNYKVDNLVINDTTSIPPPTNNFSITAKKVFNNVAITNFNASIINGTKTWNFTTTTGTINANPFKVNQAKPLVTITTGGNTYFTKTYTNFNLTKTALQTNLTQAEATIVALLKVFGIPVLSPSFFAVGSSQPSGTILRFNIGKANVTFFKTGYYNLTQEFTFTALQNNTRTITGVYNSKLNISTYQLGALIGGVTTNITWLGSGAGLYTEQQTPVGKSSIYNVQKSLAYNISAIKGGTGVLTKATYTPTGMYSVYNISLLRWNTFNFIFKNAITNVIITPTNISIELISDSYSTNGTTKTGKWNRSLLVPDDYTIRAKANNFYDSFWYYILTNGTYNNQTLYMTSNSTGVSVNAFVYDQTGAALEGAYVKVKRYDTATNSYIVKEIGLTNYIGKTVIHPVLGTEFYKFTIEYNGEVVKETSATYIYNTDPIVFYVTIGGGVMEDFFEATGGGVTHSLDYNTVTKNARFTYNDAANGIYGGQLDCFATFGVSKTTVGSTTINSPSTTILINLPEVNGTLYNCYGYILTTSPSTKTLVDSLTIDDYLTERINSPMMLFLMIILTISFAFLITWDLRLAAIFTPLPMFFFSMLGLVTINIGLATGFVALGLVVAFLIKREWA
jgi:hypothetical protein